MEKVLVHVDENEDVHYIEGSFLGANKTLCGQHLNSISTTHVRKVGVTCKKCLKIVEKTKKKHIKELNCIYHQLRPYDRTYLSFIKMRDKINELVEATNELLEKEDNNADNKTSQ